MIDAHDERASCAAKAAAGVRAARARAGRCRALDNREMMTRHRTCKVARGSYLANLSSMTIASPRDWRSAEYGCVGTVKDLRPLGRTMAHAHFEGDAEPCYGATGCVALGAVTFRCLRCSAIQDFASSSRATKGRIPCMSMTNTNAEPVAVNVVVTATHLRVFLSDGREIAAPIAWFPRLARATPEQCTNWRLIGTGSGIHWPDVDVDEDVSVVALLTSR